MDNYYEELMHFVSENTDDAICRNWANDLRKKDEAAQIAQEADELISQLHDALNESMGWNWLDDETDPPDSVLDKCNSALDKYNQYKRTKHNE